MKLWYFHLFSVFVWTGDYDSNMLRVVAYLFENGGKNLRNKKYPDTCGRFKNVLLFLPLSSSSPPSSLLRLPNYCLTNLCTSMLISRFLVSSLFSFLLYFRKRVLLMVGFTIFCPSSFVSFFVIVTNMERMEIY